MKAKSWFILYAISAQFWLLALLNTPLTVTKQSYISDLFIIGNFEPLFYRLLSIISGIILFIFAKTITTSPSNKWQDRSVVVTKLLAVLTIIDGLFVDTCLSLDKSCHPTGVAYWSTIVHGIESILSICLLFLLCIFIYKIRPRAQVQIVIYTLILGLLFIAQLISSYLHTDKGLWQRLFTLCAIVPFYYLIPTTKKSPKSVHGR